jgi:hypothetical protein
MPRLPTIVLACCVVLASWGQSQAAEPETGAPPQNSKLTAELFYQILVSELSLQNDDIASAYGLTLDAARRAQDPVLFQRAVEVALRGRDGGAALQAAKAWQQARARHWHCCHCLWDALCQYGLWCLCCRVMCRWHQFARLWHSPSQHGY